MKTLFITFVFFFCFSITTLAQFIMPRIFIRKIGIENKSVLINYSFENCKENDKYFVWAKAFDESNNELRISKIDGDINQVYPSAEKKIVWNIEEDSLQINEKVRVQLFAARLPEIAVGRSYLLSTAMPGLGHSSVGGFNKYLLGSIGYAGIGGSVLLNRISANSSRKYASEFDKQKSEKFYNDAKKFQLLSLTSLGIGISMWLTDYILLSRQIKKSKGLSPSDIIENENNYPVLSAISPELFIQNRNFPPNLYAELSFTDQDGNGILDALEKALISIKLTNQGKGNAYNLRTVILNNTDSLDLKVSLPEPVVLLKPNETTTISIPLEASINLKSAEHKFQIHVKEKFGYDMDPADLIFQSTEYISPNLMVAGMAILDTGPGISAVVEDGKLQAGEHVMIRIVIQNRGEGISRNTRFNVSTSDENIFLDHTSGNMGDIGPGEVKDIYIAISPNKRVSANDTLLVFLDLFNEFEKGILKNYRLPLMLDQKPTQTNIVNLLTVKDDKSKNTARFEYKSKKITAATGDLINIGSIIPGKTKRKNSVGLVLGIETYENIFPAPYAVNDANLMKEYFEKVLGIEKVYLYTNQELGIAMLNRLFHPDFGELKKAIIKGETEIFIYFSGHGVPDKAGENTYLFPFDGMREDLESFAYNTSKLYENLCRMQAKRVTVILDACFSGGSRSSEKIREENLIAQKGVIIKAGKPWLENENFTMINSSLGMETSLGNDQSQTGLFTYYLCAGLQGKADENGDRKVSFGELKKYVIQEVKSHSVKISGIQTPEFSGKDETIMVEY